VFGRVKAFEPNDVWLIYGDQTMSESEWSKKSRKCEDCKGEGEKLFSCNSCNRTMNKNHGLVTISSLFDLSGYLNHSSDPASINFEKVCNRDVIIIK
jgi:hypothetical protein